MAWPAVQLPVANPFLFPYSFSTESKTQIKATYLSILPQQSMRSGVLTHLTVCSQRHSVISPMHLTPARLWWSARSLQKKRVTMCLLLDMVACACQDPMHRTPTTSTGRIRAKTSVPMELELDITVLFTHLVLTIRTVDFLFAIVFSL